MHRGEVPRLADVAIMGTGVLHSGGKRTLFGWFGGELTDFSQLLDLLGPVATDERTSDPFRTTN